MIPAFLFSFFGFCGQHLTSFDLSSPPIYCTPSSKNIAVICKRDRTYKRFTLMAPTQNQIMWDLSMSPYAGGADLLFGTKILEKMETYFTGKISLSYAKTSYARALRLSELISIWLPINYFTMLLQHEIFGHGYRIRDLATHNIAKVEGYCFQWPPPYGPGGGSTHFSIAPNFTTTEASAVASAGVEATAILALITKLKWLSSGKIDPRQSLLYLLCEQDLTLYISSLKLKEMRSFSGHDIMSYIESLNYTYTEHFLNCGRLRSLSWINFADPFTFYAIYAWFHYLSSGKETKIPMIGSIYLPGLRLGLTPFGPELFIEHFFSSKRIPFYAYLKGGYHSINTYLGAGIFLPCLWTYKRGSIGLRSDLWYQPKLLLEPGKIAFENIDLQIKPNPKNPIYPYSEQHAMRFGGACSLIIAFKPNPITGFEAELGYKAQGFLPGYSLFAYPTIRLSFLSVF